MVIFVFLYLCIVLCCVVSVQKRTNKCHFLSSRDHLLSVLGKIVGKKMMEVAGDGHGRIGSKAIRQHAATLFLKRSHNPNEAMKRIGGSAKKARENYVDPTGNSELFQT